MRELRAWCLRFAGLFRKERRDCELAEELESHLQMHIEDNLRSGMNPAEARRQALIKLGGVEQTKENCRDRRGSDGVWFCQGAPAGTAETALDLSSTVGPLD